MVNTVSTNTFLSDYIVAIRDDLAANITDPTAATRPSSQKFVMTSYPQRTAQYPIITVKAVNIQMPTRLGMGSAITLTSLPVEVRIWARNVKERDTLTQQVINRLRSNQDGASGSVASHLLDLKLLSSIPVDEEGQAGIKSMVNQFQYKFLLGATW